MTEENFFKSTCEIALWDHGGLAAVLGPALFLPPGSIFRVVRRSDCKIVDIWSVEHPTYWLRAHALFKTELVRVSPLEVLARV